MAATEHLKAPSGNSNLDLLRSLAVLSVFESHALTPYGGAGVWNTVWHLGQLGVFMFFVHTSLVLMYSMERLGLEYGYGAELFKRFYVRRAFRIYPLAIVCVTLTGIFQFYNGTFGIGHHRWHLRTWLTNLSLTENLFYHKEAVEMVGGFWTLFIEVQMYFLLPFLFVRLKAVNWKWALVVWSISIPVALLQLHFAPRLNMLSYAPCFISGMLAWKLVETYKPRLSGWYWPTAIAAAAMIWFVGSHEYQAWFRWAFCLVLGALIPWFAPIRNDLVNRITATIAKYSYGIYVSHMFCQKVAFGNLRNHSELMIWATLVVLASALPVVFYYSVEKPMIDVGKYLTSTDEPMLKVLKHAMVGSGTASGPRIA